MISAKPVPAGMAGRGEEARVFILPLKSFSQKDIGCGGYSVVADLIRLWTKSEAASIPWAFLIS